MEHTAGDLVTATDRVIARTAYIGLQASSLNAILLGPDTLAVISHHDPTAGTGHVCVWPDDERSEGMVWPPYRAMLYTRRPGFEAVVSSGPVPEPTATGWNSLPNNMMWSVALTTAHSALRPLAPHTPGPTPVPAPLREG